MGLFKSSCKVCDTTGAREVVDKLLQDGKLTIKQIAAEVGIAKSIIGRHKLKCWVKFEAQKIRQGKFDPNRDSVLVSFLGAPPELYFSPQPFAGQVVPPNGQYWCLQVDFETPLPPRTTATEPPLPAELPPETLPELPVEPPN